MLIVLTKRVRQDLLLKSTNDSCMRPRLQSDLIAYHRRKARTPARAWIVLNHILNRIIMKQMGVCPSIIYAVSYSHSTKTEGYTPKIVASCNICPIAVRFPV